MSICRCGFNNQHRSIEELMTCYEEGLNPLGELIKKILEEGGDNGNEEVRAI